MGARMRQIKIKKKQKIDKQHITLATPSEDRTALLVTAVPPHSLNFYLFYAQIKTRKKFSRNSHIILANIKTKKIIYYCV